MITLGNNSMGEINNQKDFLKSKQSVELEHSRFCSAA
jgi:hypothetical protein